MDKRLVTASYLALTTGIAALAALLFARLPNFSFLPFKLLGVNAILMFMVHAVLVIAAHALVPSGSPAGAILLTLVAMYAACFAVPQQRWRTCSRDHPLQTHTS